MKKQKIEGQQIPELGIDLYEVILMHLDDPRDIVKLITMNKRIWSRYKKHKKYLMWAKVPNPRRLYLAVRAGLSELVHFFKASLSYRKAATNIILRTCIEENQLEIYREHLSYSHNTVYCCLMEIVDVKNRDLLEVTLKNLVFLPHDIIIHMLRHCSLDYIWFFVETLRKIRKNRKNTYVDMIYDTAHKQQRFDVVRKFQQEKNEEAEN